jgi:hypothetical protein
MMGLVDLIRIRDFHVATAIPAIFATDEVKSGVTVARIATVAIANSSRSEPSQFDKAHLARLVNRVLTADGWTDKNDLAEAIGIAQKDYDSALVCFTDMAERMCIED